MFCAEEFATQRIRLAPGDGVLLYTDGLTEALDPDGEEYGVERLISALASGPGRSPAETVSACLASLDEFRRQWSRGDDLTVLALRRGD